MLDDLDRLRAADEKGFLARLYELPGSFDGPDGLLREPYGATGFGEASKVPRLLQTWFDAPVVVQGTQFLLAGGFDYGELAPLKLSAEMAGAEVVVVGFGAHEPDFIIKRGPLSFYSYACYLAHATGHAQALEEAEAAMTGLRDRLAPTSPTDENPAKRLAWALFNRIPLFAGGKDVRALPEQFQFIFGRTGKVLALSAGDHPLEFVTGAFEAKHRLGDDIVAVLVGSEDEETLLAAEVLQTRVAQVERLEIADGALRDQGARAIALWYLAMHAAAYLALLQGESPEDNDVYRKVARVANS